MIEHFIAQGMLEQEPKYRKRPDTYAILVRPIPSLTKFRNLTRDEAIQECLKILFTQ